MSSSFTCTAWLKVSHNVSECALSLHPLNSSSLSTVSETSLISSLSLSWSSSFMWSKPPSTKTPSHPQNEEYCPVAVQNPLAGYPPSSTTSTTQRLAAIFQNESGDKDTEPSYSCDAELDDELIGKALSSPLLIQVREEPANLRQAHHSHEKSLLSSQSLSVDHARTVRPFNEFGSLISNVRENPCRDSENEQIRILLEQQNQFRCCCTRV